MSVTLHTSLGDLKIEVFCESVPKTAENFLALCASSSYDHSPIHRLHPAFILQAGSPASDPKSRTSRSIHATASNPSGFFACEIRPGLRHAARGAVGMANKGAKDRDTNGSQFYVTFGPQPHLDGQSTVFGRVIGGWETLDAVEAVEADGKGRPKERIEIEKVTVHANPLAG